MSTGLLDRLLGRVAERQTARAESYRDLVAQVADGAEVDESLADAILLDNAKTVEDLKAAVDLLQKRRKWRALLDEQPPAEARLQELYQERDALAKKFKALQDEYDASFGRMEYEISSIKSRRPYWGNAEQDLRNTAYSELQEELAEIHQKSVELRRKEDALQKQIDTYKHRAEQEALVLRQQEGRSAVTDGTRFATAQGFPDRAKDAKESIRLNSAQVEKLKPELEQVKAEFAALNARVKEIHEAMLQP